jgi:hypothetical protein
VPPPSDGGGKFRPYIIIIIRFFARSFAIFFAFLGLASKKVARL